MALPGDANRQGLWFITSDELLVALARQGRAMWTVSVAEYT